jgi:hypothetical protein
MNRGATMMFLMVATVVTAMTHSAMHALCAYTRQSAGMRIPASALAKGKRVRRESQTEHHGQHDIPK